MWDDLVLVYFEGEVRKQEIEHLGFKAQYSNIYDSELWFIFMSCVWMSRAIRQNYMVELHAEALG